MATPTSYFVDPSIAGASGAGTIGDPYGDIQHALDTITQNTTAGDILNIKAGTDEILTASLDLTSYTTPANYYGLYFRGYTSAEGDGGIGGISGNGSYGIFDSAHGYIHFRDMHLHNSGAQDIFYTTNWGCTFVNCEINNTSANGVYTTQDYFWFKDCHFHDIGGYGVRFGDNCTVEGCYFENGTKDFNTCIYTAGVSPDITRNFFNLDGNSGAMYITSGNHVKIRHNSVLSSGGTISAIKLQNNNRFGWIIYGNLIEGFSGVGGSAFTLASQNATTAAHAYNGVYNCTSHYVGTLGGEYVVSDDNEVLGSSPFAKTGSNTFANRLAYYAPVDVGNVLDGVFP